MKSIDTKKILDETAKRIAFLTLMEQLYLRLNELSIYYKGEPMDWVCGDCHGYEFEGNDGKVTVTVNGSEYSVYVTLEGVDIYPDGNKWQDVFNVLSSHVNMDVVLGKETMTVRSNMQAVMDTVRLK